MNKRIRGLKRSISRWCRHHGIDIDSVLTSFGLARLDRTRELEQEVRGLKIIVEDYERACGLIDEEALYQ